MSKNALSGDIDVVFSRKTKSKNAEPGLGSIPRFFVDHLQESSVPLLTEQCPGHCLISVAPL
ncbi:MAG: hypothetical protein ABIP89_04755, partial [Polyangiaceae bacterium]